MKRTAMKRSRRDTGPTQAVRDLVHYRDRMGCTVCLGEYALQVHHRLPRRAGGTRRPEVNGPANLVLLCLRCHAHLESQRTTAQAQGYLLPAGATPADHPLVWRGAWVWLLDDGGVLPLSASDLAARDVLISDTGGEHGGAA